jgi:hypothetical protein
MNQTNRPHGWSFKNVVGGVIRDMKLWKVCIPSLGP